MTKIHFIVEEAPEGGFYAHAVGVDIMTEADSREALHAQVRDAIRCHFDDADRPELIHLHFTYEESIAA